MLALASGKATTDPLVSQVLFCQRINRFLGVSLLPGQVEELPQELVDVVVGLTSSLPKMQAAERQVEEHLAKWRASHPAYKN